MIFYFSGTGNSLYVAQKIAQYHNEKLISIAKEFGNTTTYPLHDHEVIGFVFPIYAWGPPSIVLQFIKKLTLNNQQENYVFCVATCAGSAGNVMKVMNDCLCPKGLQLMSGFSVIMPNNYIIIGDVDSKKRAAEKLALAEKTVQSINDTIEQRKREFKVKKGTFPWLLTGCINPMFTKRGVNPKKFYANEHCTGCGICAKVCNCHNITVAQKPQWGSICTQCLACLHYCPTRAIQYGKGTEKKGRYTNPNISLAEMCSD